MGLLRRIFGQFYRRHTSRPFIPEEFKTIYNEAVALGYILHNDLPIQRGYNRCLVTRPVGLANLLLERVGLRIRSMYHSISPQPDTRFALANGSIPQSPEGPRVLP